MRSIKRTTIISFVVGLLALGLILMFPVLYWYMGDETRKDVFIIDKTIPDETYREHKGLTWVLNHEKWVKGDGTPYSEVEDYTGFRPEDEKDYTIDSFPETLVGQDLIYLADSYGVYEEEWFGKESEGDRSDIIYGGMKQEEVSLISEAVQQGSTFVAEFNAFGSPTDDKAREGLYSILNLEWSGWIGRYFDDLSADGEVPGWAISNYEKQNEEEWDFSDQGLIFVNEDDSIIVIEKDEVGNDTVQFSFNDQGKKWFEDSLVKDSMSYV
ncbi:hypothetical protein IQ283_22190, partial [Alkalihalobacillus hwajinpoensis]|nr:hypothetical protein [Pseudalkalibacillus hwajinpoensis]